MRGAEIVETLSLTELVDLRDRCEIEIKQRQEVIDKALTARFLPLDSTFICVYTVATFRGARLETLGYRVKHPAEDKDPVRNYYMTVKTDKPGIPFVPVFSTGTPNGEQMAKIAKIDPELRALYASMIAERPGQGNAQ